MSCRRLSATVLSLLGLLAGVEPVAAQTVRTLPQSVVMSHAPLTAEQTREVQQYLELYGRQLTTADSATGVSDARGKLIEPLRVPGASAVFRNVYSERLLPLLRDAIDRGTSETAVNALQVAGYVGTHQMLSLALQHCEAGAEKRPEVRVWAAKAVVLAFRQKVVTGNLPQQALRTLHRAALAETDWLALRSQLAAFRDVPDAQAREQLVDCLTRVIDRIGAEPGPSELLQEAVFPAINVLRMDYLNMPAPAQEALGPKIGPCLGKVLAVTKSHWTVAQTDSRAKASYGGIVDLSEKFLQAIHTGALKRDHAPPLRAKQAWDRGDLPAFEALDAQWASLLAQPPYKP